MAGEHYSEFIEEAFIKPIRSVLIVDDDYPTFDEILGSQVKRNSDDKIDSTKSWYTNPDQIKGLIDRFRTPGHPLLVDIHDGTNVSSGEEKTVASHLHQSDLLVLDYQLDKLKPGDGSLAIEILRSVTSNDHFNLVVIHTTEPLDIVFNNVLTALINPLNDGLSEQEMENSKTLIEAKEDEKEGFSKRLFEAVSDEQYIYSRRNPTRYRRTMNDGHQPYTAFKEICEEAKWSKAQPLLVLKYLLNRVEKSLIGKMNPSPSGELIWSAGAVKWIRADSVFVAFSNKTDEDDLLEELQKALNNWSPQPSRLFLTKLRAEMDEYGVVAQGQALGNTHALAHWYRRLLKANGSQRRWQIAESVSRHSDQLLSAILPRVEDFAFRLIEAEVASGDPDEISKEHFKVDLRKDNKKLLAEREHNAFVCSKIPEGWHLTTGDVFTLENDYWVCLSPACDMVPSQMSEDDVTAFRGSRPFIAVKLERVRDTKIIKDVHTNRYVFLRIDSKVKTFRFSTRNESAPHWRTLYAEKRGEFVKGTFDFNVLCTEPGSRKLKFEKYPAKVVSQLRYEYALNLMQKLGVTMTRVGLDFV